MTDHAPSDDQEPRFAVERRAGGIAVKLSAPVDDADSAARGWRLLAFSEAAALRDALSQALAAPPTRGPQPPT